MATQLTSLALVVKREDDFYFRTLEWDLIGPYQTSEHAEIALERWIAADCGPISRDDCGVFD